MKRYIVMVLSLLLLAAMTACGDSPRAATAGSETGAPTQSPSETTLPETQPLETVAVAYDALVERLFCLVSNPYDVGDTAPGELGVIEAARSLEGKAGEAIGYHIGDLNGDSIPELAVGTLPEYGGQIHSLYTLVEGRPQLVFEGWYRSSYRYLGKGRFFYIGASSAVETGQGFFSLSQDATTLICEEFYFTHAANENASDIQVYFNTTGSWDIGQSQLTQIPVEDFWSWNPEQADLSLTTFFDYGTQRRKDTANGPIHVQWGESALPGLENYLEYVADEEYAAPVLITTERTVTDFELVYLTLREVYEDGTVSYDADPVYSLESLTPECPLVAHLSFPGDLSAYGISFVDTDGTTHRLTVQVSGKDGSLLLQETD